MKNAEVTVYRTDECGTIVVTCDGISIVFNIRPSDYSAPSNTLNNNSNSTSGNNTPQQSTASTPQATLQIINLQQYM